MSCSLLTPTQFSSKPGSAWILGLKSRFAANKTKLALRGRVTLGEGLTAVSKAEQGFCTQH